MHGMSAYPSLSSQTLFTMSNFNFMLTRQINAALFCMICTCADIGARVHLGSMPNRVHHYHIAKTGGTTIETILREKFRAEVYRSSEMHYWNVPRQDWNYSIILVREPFSWMMSALYHDVALGNAHLNDPSTSLSLESELKRSAALQRIRSASGYKLVNFQTAWLVGNKFNTTTHPIDAAKAAKDIIDTIDVVGDPLFMQATICLIYYKFSHPEFESCNCQMSNKIHKNSGLRRKSRAVQMNMNASFASLHALPELMTADVLLHAYTLSRFLDDVAFVENQMGKRLLC